MCGFTRVLSTSFWIQKPHEFIPIEVHTERHMHASQYMLLVQALKITNIHSDTIHWYCRLNFIAPIHSYVKSFVVSIQSNVVRIHRTSSNTHRYMLLSFSLSLYTRQYIQYTHAHRVYGNIIIIAQKSWNAKSNIGIQWQNDCDSQSVRFESNVRIPSKVKRERAKTNNNNNKKYFQFDLFSQIISQMIGACVYMWFVYVPS